MEGGTDGGTARVLALMTMIVRVPKEVAAVIEAHVVKEAMAPSDTS